MKKLFFILAMVLGGTQLSEAAPSLMLHSESFYSDQDKNKKSDKAPEVKKIPDAKKHPSPEPVKGRR